jgi:hypothetical protein
MRGKGVKIECQKGLIPEENVNKQYNVSEL